MDELNEYLKSDLENFNEYRLLTNLGVNSLWGSIYNYFSVYTPTKFPTPSTLDLLHTSNDEEPSFINQFLTTTPTVESRSIDPTSSVSNTSNNTSTLESSAYYNAAAANKWKTKSNIDMAAVLKRILQYTKLYLDRISSLNTPYLIISTSATKLPSNNEELFINKHFKDIYNIATKKGVDPIFVATIMSIECNYGKSSLYKQHNSAFNIQGHKNGGTRHKDNHADKSVYSASYNTYNSINESIEDFCEYVKNGSHKSNTTGSIADLINSFAYCGFAEGFGDTYDEAKTRLRATYSSRYLHIKNILQKLGYIK